MRKNKNYQKLERTEKHDSFEVLHSEVMTSSEQALQGPWPLVGHTPNKGFKLRDWKQNPGQKCQ